jgi:hypothetical protein
MFSDCIRGDVEINSGPEGIEVVVSLSFNNNSDMSDARRGQGTE